MLRFVLAAFALMLMLEGLLPLIAPKVWRETFARITRMADGQIRFFGLASLLLGAVLFILIK
ncbi:DUF2065 domain-containing protein [Uliginosibacterium sp. 31-16]|uniref:DUF2065 domain-containing protein n=1 Tax=Uliginosibacterium sp. 31-16 TaxID=3068315 RepID=UPI00273FD496|nr:DUF2065 domain-containing protein [Uliginosibacterium sp. 31-16]MDP5240997.1 DUF2065 domain-containing protein [Uliginosibacterium sp. 31-16]